MKSRARPVPVERKIGQRVVSTGLGLVCAAVLVNRNVWIKKEDLGGVELMEERRLEELDDTAEEMVSTPWPTAAPEDSFSSTQAAQIVVLIAQMCVIALMAILLQMLLQMVDEFLDREVKYRSKSDPFNDREKGQAWNWDFVMFVDIKDEEELIGDSDAVSKKKVALAIDREKLEFERKYSLLKICMAMHNAGLETAQYKSQKFDRVVIKIRCSAHRLKKHADEIDIKLKLNEQEVRQRLNEGLRDPNDNEEYIIYPRRNDWTFRGVAVRTAIQDTQEQCPLYAYYEHAYGKFDSNDPDMENLYKRYPQSSSVFRGVDRIKLILSLLTWPTSDGGAGLQLEKMLSTHVVKAAFPLHDYAELQIIMRKWLVYWAWPWQQPIDRIKNYFGEKIGFYFLFLGHYTTFLLYASLVGVAVFIHTLNDPRQQNAPSIPFFCVFISIWTTLFLEFWKRKQARYAMLWGMVGFEEEENDRPEFADNEATVKINSPVDGEDFNYFPPEIAAKRIACSMAVTSTSILAVCITVYAIFFLNVWLSNPKIDSQLDPQVFVSRKLPSFPLRSNIIGLANTVQIMVMEALYFSVAQALNDYENHRSETEYEDSLIAKTFIFTFVNAYASFVYTAFIKRMQAQVPGLAQPYPASRTPRLFDCVGSCMIDLQTQLSTIFITRVLISNLKSVLIPYFFWSRAQSKKRKRERAEARRQAARLEAGEDDDEEEAEDDVDPAAGDRDSGDAIQGGDDIEDPKNNANKDGASIKSSTQRLLSPAEEQFKLEEYHVMLGPFADYAELITILGFAVLFVGAFPLAPLMALVNSYVEIRVDGWRIAQTSRRPWPAGAEDIGTWNDIIELMSYLAVIINGLIITYTGDFLVNRTNAMRFAVFIAYCHALFFFKYLIAILIDDTPSDVQVQIDRQTFIEDKLIKKVPDPDLEVFVPDLAASKKSDNEAHRQGPDLTIYDEDDDHVYLDLPGYERYKKKRIDSIAAFAASGTTGRTVSEEVAAAFNDQGSPTAGGGGAPHNAENNPFGIIHPY